MKLILTKAAGLCWDLVDYRDRNGYRFGGVDFVALRVMYHLDALATRSSDPK